jgi:hypothetical protein
MKFKTPMDIQNYLNKMKYNGDENFKCPANVEKLNSANCTEGAFFAADELRKLGMKTFIVVMTAENDDDHLIAAFRKGKYWGAVAKSNTSVLRFREPVYASVRELVMSYFDMYFNTKNVKTLRKYSEPIPIENFEKFLSEDNADYWPVIEDARYFNILTRDMIKDLEEVDPELYKLCFALSDWEGIYKAE